MNEISENKYKKACEIIRQFKTQVENQRKEEFKKKLSEYDKTYWHFKGRFKEVYLSVIAEEHTYIITRFIVNTNGIIEIKCDYKRKEDLEYLLADMGEYAPDEWELQEGRNNTVFKNIAYDLFLAEVSCVLIKLKISDSEKIKIIGKNWKGVSSL